MNVKILLKKTLQTSQVSDNFCLIKNTNIIVFGLENPSCEEALRSNTEAVIYKDILRYT